MRYMPAALLCATLVVAGGPALAADAPATDHAEHPEKVVAISEEMVNPLNLTMGTDDQLVFDNVSGKVLRITFLEPDDVAAKVRCRDVKRLSENEALAPGALFRRRQDDLIALVAPSGRVSLCGLAAGHYVYTVESPDLQPSNTPVKLGQKGTIDVR